MEGNKPIEKTQIIETQIAELESKLTGEMFADMEIRERIHQLKMELNGVKPERKEANTLYCNC